MNNRFLPVIILGLIIILSSGWYQLIYEPARQEILSMELETRKLREIEREILELKARHENLAAFVEAKEDELDAARNFLPPTLAQDSFIDTLYRASDFHKVQLISVQTREINSREELQAQTVKLHLEADYVSLLKFIREILDGERLAILENFSATSAGNGIISCELSFKIFAEPIQNSID